MSRWGKTLRSRRHPVRCTACNATIPKWPAGGCILTNDRGTQEMKVCLKCMNVVLNTNGVKVIGDNVGRDQ